MDEVAEEGELSYPVADDDDDEVEVGDGMI